MTPPSPLSVAGLAPAELLDVLVLLIAIAIAALLAILGALDGHPTVADLPARLSCLR